MPTQTAITHMENFILYLDAYTELRNDLLENYTSPVLRTAINQMCDYYEKWRNALDEMYRCGYIADDALRMREKGDFV